MSYIFIGGFFPDDQIDMIQKNSSGVVQNAANVFQTNLLKGFDAVFDNSVTVINLPFIGSYPNRFKKIYYPASKSTYLRSIEVNGLGFLNIAGIKYFSRFLVTLNALLKNNDSEYVFIYSMHVPFIAAAVFAKKTKLSNSKICLIVPDLPEYMSDGGGFFYSLLKTTESKLFPYLLSNIDKYILLTSEMAKKLNLLEDQYLVVEGIADEVEIYKNIDICNKRVIFYSGTLAKRYGVCDLVEAFLSLNDKNIELWICGDGDSREYIDNISKIDARINYLGQLPRDEVVKLQQQATILVNPRRPEGDYTKYSFPSKVMEYMCSGRPVVMHKLSGIPVEYYDHCYSPTHSSVSSLQECLSAILNLSDEELDATGKAARDFVLNNKSYFKQAEKIRKFILRSI